MRVHWCLTMLLLLMLQIVLDVAGGVDVADCA
jgi:hypothetical protein